MGNVNKTEKKEVKPQEIKEEIQVWGQDAVGSTLPNNLEINFPVDAPEAEKKRMDTRTTGHDRPAPNKVSYFDSGVYFSTKDYGRVTKLDEHYRNKAGLAERRPFDEIDPLTNQPTNYIKEGFKLYPESDKLGNKKYPPTKINFDPLNTYDPTPLRHPEQMKEALFL